MLVPPHVRHIRRTRSEPGKISAAVRWWHDNEGDADSAATTAASFTQITSTGVATKPVASGLKQLWRLQYSVDSSGGEYHEEWVIVDAMTPSWRRS